MPVTDQTPNVIIMDSSETFMEVSGGVAVPSGTKGLLFAGIQSNGSASYLLTDTGGRLTITGSVTVPNTLTVTGSLSLSQTATVTGSVTVPNTVTVTGSVGITNYPVTQSVTGTVGISGIPTVTGSVSVLNTVTVTGSIGVNGLSFVSGALSVFVSGTNTQGVTGTVGITNFPVTQSVTGTVGISGIPTVTGSITVPNTVTVTGSVGISGTPTVTGSVSVLNTVNVSFSDPAEGTTGSAAPSKAIFVAGFDAGSSVIRGFSVDAAGKLNVNATAAGSPNVGGTGSTAPTSASLDGGVDAGGILRPLLTDNTGKQIIQVFNTASITGSVGISGIPTVTGSITVPNTVTVTGSISVTNVPTVTGSITVANIPTVTGSVSVLNTVNTTDRTQAGTGALSPFTGSLVGGKDNSGNFQPFSLDASRNLIVTGTVTVANVPTVTGSISVTNVPTVTGSITVPNTVNVTGSVGVNGYTFVSGSSLVVFVTASNTLPITGTITIGAITDPAEGLTGSAAPSKAMYVGGKDPVSGTLQQLAIRTSASAPAVSDNALVVVISPNQQAIPTSNSPANTTPGIGFGLVTTSATTQTAVRNSTYNEQTTNAQRSISSAAVADASAGTGARQVLITYYDSTGAGPSTETITLNGTTAVNTVSTTICFIESIIVSSVGSGLVNAGVLTLFIGTAGGGGTLATVLASDNTTFWAHHYVATGKVCHVSGLSGNNNNASNGSILVLKGKVIGAANKPEVQVSDFVRVGGATAQPVRFYNSTIRVSGPARIVCYSSCEGTPNIITRAAFDFYDQ